MADRLGRVGAQCLGSKAVAGVAGQEVTGQKRDILHPLAQRYIKIGVIAGAVIAVLELKTPKHLKKWVPSATGIGLGMILPFFYPFAMFLGAVGGEITKKFFPKWAERYLVAIAAGGIAGESIIGVIVAALNNFVFV